MISHENQIRGFLKNLNLGRIPRTSSELSLGFRKSKLIFSLYILLLIFTIHWISGDAVIYSQWRIFSFKNLLMLILILKRHKGVNWRPFCNLGSNEFFSAWHLFLRWTLKLMHKLPPGIWFDYGAHESWQNTFKAHESHLPSSTRKSKQGLLVYKYRANLQFLVILIRLSPIR